MSETCRMCGKERSEHQGVILSCFGPMDERNSCYAPRVESHTPEQGGEIREALEYAAEWHSDCYYTQEKAKEALALISESKNSDAQDLALELAYGIWEPNTLYEGARNAWLRDAALMIERYAAEQVRKARAEVDALRMTADRRDYALRLYGTQFEEVFQLAHRRPVPSSLASMLCNMTERHSCEMAKAFTQDEIARRMATRAAFNKEAGNGKERA